MRIARVEGDVDATAVVVLVEGPLPALAAVDGAKDSALRIRAERMTERGDEHDISVLRIDNHLADGAGIVQAYILPGLAAIDSFVDAIALGRVAANAAFTGADVNHVRVRGSDRNTADRRRRLFIEDRIPGHGSVGGLPHTATGRAEVINVGIAGNADRGKRSSAAKLVRPRDTSWL